MAEYIIASYLRFSLDEAKAESTSIESQRKIVNKHIAALEIPDTKIIEFVDDGYSGTNYERPAVQQLLELVRLGKVNCIIVKDFSRFGRNAIEAGYFLERVFPLFRIRFISVTDYHDSADYVGDTGGMEVAFKLLIYEQYSRDLSEKVKSAKRARALRGEYIMKNCIFGYKKVGNRLEVDGPAAEVVRLIFDMAAQGKGLSEIAARLYHDNHPSPSEYRQKESTGAPTCIWNVSVIQSMIANEQYIGTYISGKSKTMVVGSRKTVSVDESEWIKIPNHHPAIVSVEVFDAVRMRATARKHQRQANKRLGTKQRYIKNDSPLNGKVFCGHCGYTMRPSSTRNSSFHCRHTLAAPDADCHRLKMLRSELESELLESILAQARAIIDGACVAPEHTEGHDERLCQINDAKRSLYERFILGEVKDAEYKHQKETLDSDHHMTKQARETSIKDSTKQSFHEDRRAIAQDMLEKGTLVRQAVDALIEKVLVYRDSRIEVLWRKDKSLII